MKKTEKKEPVPTIPQGVWESSRPSRKTEEQNSFTETTDLQGNGYPDRPKKTRA